VANKRNAAARSASLVARFCRSRRVGCRVRPLGTAPRSEGSPAATKALSRSRAIHRLSTRLSTGPDRRHGPALIDGTDRHARREPVEEREPESCTSPAPNNRFRDKRNADLEAQLLEDRRTDLMGSLDDQGGRQAMLSTPIRQQVVSPTCWAEAAGRLEHHVT
jgi:hypothetical protein